MATIARILRRAGGPFILMGAGFFLAFAGLAGDYYQHEIAGFSVALESFFAPVHVMIFAGIFVAALGVLWGLLRGTFTLGSGAQYGGGSPPVGLASPTLPFFEAQARHRATFACSTWTSGPFWHP